MNNCITAEDPTTGNWSEDCILKLNYAFLVHSDDQTHSELEILNTMTDSTRHYKAIEHPLIQTLLYVKWCQLRPYYWASVAFSMFYVTFLTLFVLFLKGNYDSTASHVFRGLVSFLTLMIVIREIFQFVSFKCKYFWQLMNWLQLTLVVTVGVLLVPVLPEVYALPLAAWSIFLSW